MKKVELILGIISLLLGGAVMLGGLINPTANLGFFLALGLIPVNMVIATDIANQTNNVSLFNLRQFLGQDSALFMVTFGLLLLSISLVILRLVLVI